jgi:beta propeller repeat protein
MRTGAVTQLTDSRNAYWPDIYGELIVWSEYRNYQRHDIFMYDVSTGEETQITNDSELQTMPSIWGDRVIWLDYRNSEGEDSGECDVYMYDIGTGEETRLTENGYYYETPRICGDTVVWNRFKGMSGGLYAHDIPSGRETLLRDYANEGEIISDFDIDGRDIAYSQYQIVEGDTDSNIYMMTLSGGSSILMVAIAVIGGIIAGAVIAMVLLRKNRVQPNPPEEVQAKNINTGKEVERP